jgi:hypothetical protein
MTTGNLSALEKALATKRAMREAGTLKIKSPLEKLADNPTSFRAAVNAKCYQCEGEDADPHVKARIGSCQITTCGLWAVRPYQPRPS